MTLQEKAKQYNKLSSEDKKEFITEAYHTQKMSFKEIANIASTYPNRIRRDAHKLGISVRDKSAAQKMAIETGKVEHPTEGKHRSESVKVKIGEGRAKAWENLSPEELKRISDMGKQQWEKMSEQEKQAFHKAAGDAIRKASKEGSKLEKFLHQGLIEGGYQVEFHKERMIKNERLQIDLWIPKLNTAIEVDGPSHFKPIWGKKSLARNQQSDSAKTGLLLGTGAVIVRIKQNKKMSEKYKRDTLSMLLNQLDSIKENFPPVGKRHIILGDE